MLYCLFLNFELIYSAPGKNTVKFEEMDLDPLKAFLEYLYSGHAPIDADSNVDTLAVLGIADRYFVSLFLLNVLLSVIGANFLL